MENLTHFFNHAANAPQNTGGGNSQTSTLVATAKKGSRPTVNRRSTDSQPKAHRTHTPLCKALKYVACLLLVLFVGVGNVWGTDSRSTITWDFTTNTFLNGASWSSSSNANNTAYATDGTTTLGHKASGSGDSWDSSNKWLKTNGKTGISSNGGKKVANNQYFSLPTLSGKGVIQIQTGTKGANIRLGKSVADTVNNTVAYWAVAASSIVSSPVVSFSESESYYMFWDAQIYYKKVLWIPYETVTFDATTNGGTCATATADVAKGGTLATLPTATKDGCSFLGWFDAETSGNQLTISTTISDNVTYYAQYSCGGGGGSSDPSIDLTEGTVSVKSKASAAFVTATTTLTGSNLTDGTYNVTTSASGLSISPTSFTVSGGSVSQTFTVSYTGNSSGSESISFSDGTTSTSLTANYSTQAVSTDATLSSVTIGGVTATLAGSAGSYTAKIDRPDKGFSMTQDVTFVTSDANATVKLTNASGEVVTSVSGHNFASGNLVLYVLAEDGSTYATYTVSMTTYDKYLVYLTTSATPSENIYNTLSTYASAHNYKLSVWNVSSDLSAANMASKYDLVILAEAPGSSNNTAKAVGSAIGNVPVLNFKGFMFGKNNWPSGTGNNLGTGENAIKTATALVPCHTIYNNLSLTGASTTVTLLSSNPASNKNGVQVISGVSAPGWRSLAKVVKDETTYSALLEYTGTAGANKAIVIPISNDACANISTATQTIIGNALAYLLDNTALYTINTTKTISGIHVAGFADGNITDNGDGTYSLESESAINSTDNAVTVDLSSNCASYSVDYSGLTEGYGDVTITVTAESGATGTYTLTVSAPVPASGWSLHGTFDGWGEGYAMSGTETVSVEQTLDANTRYEFKIVNGSDWYGNGEIFGGTRTQEVSATGTSNNCQLVTSESGKYRFDYNTESHTLTITYPNSYTYYYSNTDGWSKVYVYKFSSKDEMTGDNDTWPGVEIETPTSLCGSYYAATSDGYAKIIFTNGLTGDNEKKTSDMVVASADAGKYVAGTGSTWTAMPTFTVTYNKNGDGAGNDGAVTGNVPVDATAYACGAEVTVLGNTGSLALAGYSFAGWNTAADGSGIAKVADAKYEINANTIFYAQWTQEIPTSVEIGGTWKYFPGQTITLTATPSGGSATDLSYQWQQSNGSSWENIQGATSDTYTKENCVVADARKYRCIVSKAGASVTSNEFKVHIFTLEGDYSGGSDWKVYNIAQTSGTVGTIAVTLNASSLFEFGIKDNYENKWYRNTNFIVDNWTNEGFGQGDGNCRLFTGPEGNYIFTVDIAHVGDETPYMEVSLDYPSVTHPAAGYAYFKKWNDWAGYYIHWWYNDGSDHPLTEWGSDVRITNETTICGTDYIYFPVIANYNQLKIKDAAGDASHYTGNLSSVGSSGKYFDFTNDNAWNAFPSYTITFNSNGGSDVAEQHVSCGGTASEPTAPTRLNYDFEGWQLNGVDYNFAAVVADDITLDAVWTRKEVPGSEEAEEAYVADVEHAKENPVLPPYEGVAFNLTHGGLSIAKDKSTATNTADSKSFDYAFFPNGGTTESTCYTLTAQKAISSLVIYYTATNGSFSSDDQDKSGNITYKINDGDAVTGETGNKSNKTAYKQTISNLAKDDVVKIYASNNRLAIFGIYATYIADAPSVKLKVLGEVTQTISISVGEKLGDIFASGTLPTLDLPGYTFNGWKNEVGDVAVNNNTVISSSMVIYADLEADEYNVTLENGDTDGAATVHYGDEALTITTAVSGEEGDVLDGFYTAASEGTKVAEADGTLVANVTGYTDANGKWIKESDATLYTIWIPYVPSSDATLSDLTVGGTTVTGFSASTYEYNVELPFGTFAAPTVAGIANDTKAKSVAVTQAATANGDAIIVVTAEDNSTKTYTIHFSVVATKDLLLVFKTGSTACVGTPSTATQILSNNAAVSTYINQITFTNVEGSGDNGKEGGSLDVGKKAGNMFTLSAKAGFAMKSMNFLAKIEDANCEYSLNGGEWTTLTSTDKKNDVCYEVFADAEVHEFRLRSTGNSGVWIRNMQLTMIQACTPKTIAWTTAPASEYEVGKAGYAIAASANNGTVEYTASNAAITVAANGALTINSLTNDIDLSASVAAGDGVTYCDEGAQVSNANVKTYYLVTFDAQNETAVTEVKYYSGDAAIALPSTSYSGYVFQGWFDASTGGNKITEAVTPSASRTIYAQWIAQCAGPTITTQPASANYFVDRTASALTCEATPGVEGKALTYTWYSCDDAVRTNPVELAGAPTPSTAAVGTFYYYCAVTEEDCDVIRNSNVVTVSVTEKEMLLLIQANHVKGKTANMSGYIGGTYRKEMQDNSKLGSKGHYFGIKLASGTFQAGDRVYIHTTAGADTNGDYVRIFKSNEASAENVLVEGTEAMVSPNGDNWVTLPATTLDSLYLRRGTDTENYNKDWNPYIDIFAVYRPYPVPVLTAMTVNGSAATITGTNVAATIASNAELASLTIVPTFMSNDPANTSGDLGGPWVENEGVYTNSYVVTDKDGDTNTYLITLTRDVEIASITISGETSVAEESQITLTATVLPNNVLNKEVVWSSSDETKATVDANGVVTGKAEGSLTITATSVADGTKKGTLNITVTKFVGTEYAYWFVYAADAAANGVENNSTVFGSAPTGSNNGGFELTLEEGWTVTTTKKTGSTSSFGTFTVPADFTATWYAAVKAGGDNRVLNMKQGDVVKYSVALTNATDPEIVKIENIAAGTYNVVLTGGSSISGAYLFAAELNSYPLTSVALEEGFNLRLEQSRTPVFTITPAKAAVASQEWIEVSRTGASDATLNTSTGEITTGTEEGTLTVKVTVTDAFGNEAESGNCVVKIVNIIDQKDVTGSMTWNWTGAGTANVTIDNEEALVLGNYIDGDQWAYLKGTNGDQAYHHESSYGSYQGKGTLSFKTTVPGLVTITARRWSNTPDLKIGEDVILSLDGSNKTSKAYFVPAGEVNIIADAADGMRILKIEFDAEPTVDKIEGSHFGGYTREVNPQYYGTICLPKAGVMTGALLFQVAYMDYKADGITPYKVYYDQVENGTMQAGMPYIFLAEQSTIGVYYTGTTEETAKDHNGLYGTLTDITSGMNATGVYMLYNNKVMHSTNAASSLSANRAYIQISGIPGYGNPGYEAPAPKYRRIATGFNGTNTATGIEAVNGDGLEVSGAQKILINGEMYILRGEKMYDATGRLVK